VNEQSANLTSSLDYYLKLWDLRGPEALARSPRGEVYTAYRYSEKVVLKLLTPEGAADEADGAAALRYFDGRGAVRLLAYDQAAHLLEYAGDEELALMVSRGGDMDAAAVIADVVNELHRSRLGTPAPRLRTLQERFRSLFDRAARDEAAGEESIFVRGARVARRLLAEPQDECVLHGDIQHHNIRRHPERGWLAYDPKGLYGERLYDVGNALCNPSTAPELVMSEDRYLRMSRVLAERMQADLDRLRAFAFAFACLSASWPDKPDGSEIQEWFLTVARNAERHVENDALE
jgi:streptomycin 6-kinase